MVNKTLALLAWGSSSSWTWSLQADCAFSPYAPRLLSSLGVKKKKTQKPKPNPSSLEIIWALVPRFSGGRALWCLLVPCSVQTPVTPMIRELFSSSSLTCVWHQLSSSFCPESLCKYSLFPSGFSFSKLSVRFANLRSSGLVESGPCSPPHHLPYGDPVTVLSLTSVRGFPIGSYLAVRCFCFGPEGGLMSDSLFPFQQLRLL